MNRLEKYCGLLEHIYGKSIVDAFTVKNKNDSNLTMNSESDNLKAKKHYQRKENEGCVTCSKIYRNPNFSKRILEFPGWIGNLNFTGAAPAKEIMIIGEAPTTLKDQINISFGLGLYSIKDDGKLNFDKLKKIYSEEETQLNAILKILKGNRLWEYINLLFLNKLNVIKPKIYITDLCKCNDDIKTNNKKDEKNKNMWAKCLTKCLIEEINLVNPSLIIFQGWSSYIYVRDYLIEQGLIKSEQAILEDTKNYYPQPGDPDFYKQRFYNPSYGKFPFNGKNIYFFRIYHQSFMYSNLSDFDRNKYINQNHQFIEKKILKEVLKIN